MLIGLKLQQEDGTAADGAYHASRLLQVAVAGHCAAAVGLQLPEHVLQARRHLRMVQPALDPLLTMMRARAALGCRDSLSIVQLHTGCWQRGPSMATSGLMSLLQASGLLDHAHMVITCLHTLGSVQYV